ncbi:MAG TPA: hypothetical protein VK923_16180 [Euzebyales bacterium]|nr:hypothetical protein [Euzebyales bacterium]
MTTPRRSCARSSHDETPDRLDLLARLRTALTVVERTDHGLVLRFPARDDVEADVRRFAADEQRCCRFWGFDVTATDADVTLRWDGPPATALLLDQLLGYFRGDQPVTALTGLL